MSRNIWVTSDTHYHHANILNFTDYEGQKTRPEFSNVDEMDECMIENHNSVVKPGDIVYHLGDVFMGEGSKQKFPKLWPKLNGRKRLIVGNHDDIPYLAKGNFFQKVMMWRMFPEFGLLLTHVPIHESSAMNKNGLQMLNVHGHIHRMKSPTENHRCVCVEHTNYTPINIEELRII